MDKNRHKSKKNTTTSSKKEKIVNPNKNIKQLKSSISNNHSNNSNINNQNPINSIKDGEKKTINKIEENIELKDKNIVKPRDTVESKDKKIVKTKDTIESKDKSINQPKETIKSKEKNNDKVNEKIESKEKIVSKGVNPKVSSNSTDKDNKKTAKEPIKRHLTPSERRILRQKRKRKKIIRAVIRGFVFSIITIASLVFFMIYLNKKGIIISNDNTNHKSPFPTYTSVSGDASESGNALEQESSTDNTSSKSIGDPYLENPIIGAIPSNKPD